MKPMLAATIEDPALLEFPVLASPKLDGIRCLMIGGVAMSRNMKPIRNNHVQAMLKGWDGLDGELIVGAATASDVFNRSTSGVMSTDGAPNFQYHVFDSFKDSGGFRARWEAARDVCKMDRFLCAVPHRLIKTLDELLAYEAQMLIAGYEGIMVRDPAGAYKEGRSTLRERGLAKLKRFVDSEAIIVGYVEREHNANEQTRDELGRAKRSSAKAGKVPMGTLGALMVRDVKTKVEFEIGTGFSDELRAQIWANRNTYLNKIVKYKSQPVGVKDKPRFPVMLGFRDKNDL